jgi:glutamine synthetase type III
MVWPTIALIAQFAADFFNRSQCKCCKCNCKSQHLNVQLLPAISGDLTERARANIFAYCALMKHEFILPTTDTDIRLPVNVRKYFMSMSLPVANTDENDFIKFISKIESTTKKQIIVKVISIIMKINSKQDTFKKRRAAATISHDPFF